jgi:hypothetical protein
VVLCLPCFRVTHRALFAGINDDGQPSILSLTFARQKQDLSESQICCFVNLLWHLEEIEIVNDGAGAFLYPRCALRLK